jgi:hypothetical protein
MDRGRSCDGFEIHGDNTSEAAGAEVRDGKLAAAIDEQSARNSTVLHWGDPSANLTAEEVSARRVLSAEKSGSPHAAAIAQSPGKVR